MKSTVPSHMRHAAARIVTAFLCLGAPATVCAQTPADANSPDRVRVDLSACRDVPQIEIRRILGIEIGDLLSGADEVPSRDSARVVIVCQGGLARLEATAAMGALSAGRYLHLDAFPNDAAPRAIALAAIEVLAALSPAVRAHLEGGSGPQLQERPKAESRSAQHSSLNVSASAGLNATAGSAPTRTSEGHDDGRGMGAIHVASVLRTYLVPQGLTAWGGKVGLDRRIGTWFGAGIDLEVVGAGTHVSQGEIRSLLLSTGAFWSCQRAWGNRPALEASMGLGGRIGLARLVGNPAGAIVGDTIGTAEVVGKNVLWMWGGPAAAAALRASIGRLGFEFAAESGFALLSAEARADGQPAVSVRGTWMALSLGVSVGY